MRFKPANTAFLRKAPRPAVWRADVVTAAGRDLDRRPGAGLGDRRSDKILINKFPSVEIGVDSIDQPGKIHHSSML